MAGGHIGSALRRLRGLLGAQCAGGPTDGDLLRRYVAQGDEAAFEALLRRHGPMVLGVCRRLLGTAQDVDDAFQATFLVLIRKAPSIGDGERVGNWLYGVAYRVAVRARARAARERARQRPLADVVVDEGPGGCVAKEVLALLDEEVSRLPARYREAVVCCYLEGRTQAEAAHVLGWPKGTVSTRLNRARELLRSRLTRRGLTMTAGSVAVLLGQATAEGALPPDLAGAVLQTLARALVNGPLPAGAVALADAVLRGALVGRLREFATVALALAVVTTGGVVSFGPGRRTAAPPAVARTRPSSPPARRDRPVALPGADRTAYQALAVVVHGATELARSDSSPVRCGDEARPGPASAADETAVHILTLTLITHAGSADPLSPGTTLSVVDPVTGHVRAYMKVSAGQGWRLARLPGGQTIATADGIDDAVLAFALLPDCRAPREKGEGAPRPAGSSSVKVLHYWQVCPLGKVSEAGLPEKPRV